MKSEIYLQEVARRNGEKALKVSVVVELDVQYLQHIFSVSAYTAKQVIDAVKNDPKLLGLHRSCVPELRELLLKIQQKDPFTAIYDEKYRKDSNRDSLGNTQYALEA